MRTLLPVLLLIPGSLFAQATTTAKPNSGNTMQSVLVSAASLRPAVSKAAAKPSRTVSTGAVAPELIHTEKLLCEAKAPRLTARTMVVVVSLSVDPTGIPTHLHVDQPVDAFTDQEVLDTVSRFRYKPGTLDGQETDYPVILRYKIERGAVY